MGRSYQKNGAIGEEKSQLDIFHYHYLPAPSPPNPIFQLYWISSPSIFDYIHIWKKDLTNIVLKHNLNFSV